MVKINQALDFIHKPFQYSPARWVSTLLAMLLSLLLLFNPDHIADSTAALANGYLSILMMALTAGFVHGLGFEPRLWLWRIIFSPYLSWPVLFFFAARMFV
ncbi:cyd operon YbgE family protein [Psychromonas ossibalaenae]|uniref:cyd operon YbgE family protein n=1 Tax=Psychromonas ossibalaenae TaxID=444922 RepID=UPI000380D887|nr:cyd operon YbgE family protein [Psychromonas ossibalaenae]